MNERKNTGVLRVRFSGKNHLRELEKNQVKGGKERAIKERDTIPPLPTHPRFSAVRAHTPLTSFTEAAS